jgi:F-type H+-transporting ATPase subunit delta
VHPNNKLTINAIEAYQLDQFSSEVRSYCGSVVYYPSYRISHISTIPFVFQAVRSALAEAQRVAGGSGSAESKAEADIEVSVLTALQAALGSA